MANSIKALFMEAGQILNENGLQNTNPQDPNFHRCEDFDLNGYDEVEYFGDHSDNLDSVVWFDTENIMKSITLDLTHIVIQNRTSPILQTGGMSAPL